MFPQLDSFCEVFWLSRLIFDYFCGVDPLTAICGSPPGENRAIELRELGQSRDLLLVLLEGESVLTYISQICQYFCCIWRERAFALRFLKPLFSLLSILPNGPSLSVELDRLVDCVRHHFKDDDEQYSEASQAP